MLRRLIRHLLTTQSSGRKHFPCATLQAIQAVIAEGETVHRAEVRLIIEPALAWPELLERQTSRMRAHDLFSQYRIWDTEENCGILVYINLADHQVEIIADRGINCCVLPDEWKEVCQTMTQGFAKGDYHEATLRGLRYLNTILQRRFPEQKALQSAPPNQLSDAPIFL
ncbi:TPM domain-containing protein [Oxalicibacterium faecigallinarum]|uniref:Membrane protein n=1 Tax=Oxalicibacterium faecigallinarum TaxID=573741 RepID=A0A8J3AXF7_9BURK|nr:TPM domain-containing protein [Oxalicibacterium faecigallinarum]GGI18656.1 membrane protein [Oxalicibacterium faecigallinarum]